MPLGEPLDGAGNRVSRGLSQQAWGPTPSPHAGLGALDAVSGCAVRRAARRFAVAARGQPHGYTSS